MAEACEFFGAPVVSGNVSFYNETPEMAIYPTPVVGMLGVIDDVEKRCTSEFKSSGDVIVLISGLRSQFDEAAKAGECELESLGGSEFLNTIHGLAVGRPPALDMGNEKRVHHAILKAIDLGLISSAHDCSDGGLAVCLAESCILGKLGASVSLAANCAPAAALFAETQSRIVVSLSVDHLGALREIVDEVQVQSTVLGKVGGDRMRVRVNDVEVMNLAVSEMETLWRGAIGNKMKESGA